MKHLVAICIGHSRTGDNGATSADGTSEWEFNRTIGQSLKQALDARQIDSFVVDDYEGHGYGAAMRWVAKHVEQRHASIAVELHFNASAGQAQGHEWLYWITSSRGKRLADCLRDAYVAAFPIRKSRGSRPKSSGDRGAEFLRLTHCPAVIAEPFFGDNPDEWEFATTHREEIAEALAEGIEHYLTS